LWRRAWCSMKPCGSAPRERGGLPIRVATLEAGRSSKRKAGLGRFFMDLKWLRAFLRLTACLALVGVLAEPGSVRIVQAQQGTASGGPAPNAAKKESADPTQAITTLRVESHLVTTPVTVFDSAGQFVYDVDQNEFKIYDNGALQQIKLFGTEIHPVALVIVV